MNTEQANSIINWLYALPGHMLVGLTCVVVGYFLRFVRRFPNDGIPLVCILWGMVFNPLISDTPAPGASLRLWLVRNTLVGLIIGAGAWAIHRYVLRRIEDKIPIIGPLLDEADRRSDQTLLTTAAAKVVSDKNNSVDLNR